MNARNRKGDSSRRAFTLIELLIVVAIIAILAAIAVPNFLEAQVRSKVSRVHSDLRSVATALEAYRVDANSYPGGWHVHWPTDPSWEYEIPSAGYVLSTPVAYITEAQLRDPFKRAGTTYGDFYQLTSGSDTNANRSYDGREWPRNCFAVVSMGPNHEDDTWIGAYPWVDVATNPTYDATNGTVSLGDIYRCMPRPPISWVKDGARHSATDPYSE
jgi:prepilin-type N-terminal cleavage/methylation domain-containing protein